MKFSRVCESDGEPRPDEHRGPQSVAFQSHAAAEISPLNFLGAT